MATAKGLDIISVALKRQLENEKHIEEVESQEGELSLDTRLLSSVRRILESKVEFEKSQGHSIIVRDQLKGKYRVLSPPKKVQIDNLPSITSKDVANLQAEKRLGAGESPKRKGAKSLLESSGPPAPQVTLYPEDGIKLGWQGNEPVGGGMINLGNTCYLNSTLQALFHVPSFCNWLKSEPEHNGIGRCDQAFISGDMCLICAMASTLRITQTNTGNVMKPVLIYGRLKSICKHLSHGRQEDAHEFLRFLIEGMERCFLLRYKGKKLDNLTKETTPLHRIFGGYLRNEVVCHSCGTTSTTFQLFQDLFLDIRHCNTFMESMQAFFSRERLEGDEKNDSYKCEKCKCKGNCSKRVYVQTPPKVLCFQLKRFTAMGKKIMKHISYPLKLDLSPYVYMRTQTQNGEIISPLPKVRRPIPYKLVSVVSHYGSAMNCGHYTAVGRSAKGSYFTFDDSLVRPASMNSTLGVCAYILMYELEPGWNIGLESNTSERVKNGSLEPSKSLTELKKLSGAQNSLSNSPSKPELQKKRFSEVQISQHSKNLQLHNDSVGLQAAKDKLIKSSSLSNLGASPLKPLVLNNKAVCSPSTSCGAQKSVSLNGWLNKDFGVPISRPCSSANTSPSFIGNSSPNPKSSYQSQRVSSVIKKQPLLQLPPEVQVSKDPSRFCLKDSSGFERECEVKIPKAPLKPLCEGEQQRTNPETPKFASHKHSSSGECNKDQKVRVGMKRKHSSLSCAKDDSLSPFLHKKQLTLPDFLNKKNSVSAEQTPCPKIRTLKDWLEVRSGSKGVGPVNEERSSLRMQLPNQAVVSTVGGWKVTAQNPNNGTSEVNKSNTVVQKRRQEVEITRNENKRKKFDKVANAKLWRTVFKNKIFISKVKKRADKESSEKSKLKEKSTVVVL